MHLAKSHVNFLLSLRNWKLGWFIKITKKIAGPILRIFLVDYIQEKIVATELVLDS